MKEAVGGSWLFTLVIVFIALFTSFICLATNYSKCYKVKDEIISVIEKEHGINKESLPQINDYLKNIGYRNTGTCPNDGSCWVDFSVNKNDAPSAYGSSTNFCVKQTVKNVVDVNDNKVFTYAPIGHPSSAYYTVSVFFALDVPVLRNVFNIRLQGDTSLIFLTTDFDAFKTCHAGVSV